MATMEWVGMLQFLKPDKLLTTFLKKINGDS
jgi:hypothetical protein